MNTQAETRARSKKLSFDYLIKRYFRAVCLFHARISYKYVPTYSFLKNKFEGLSKHLIASYGEVSFTL